MMRLPSYLRGRYESLYSLAQVLCTSRRETERYLELASIDRSLLTDVEEIQLGFLPRIAPGSLGEQTHLEQLAYIYKEFLDQLGAKETEVGVSSSPPNLKLKIQEYTNILQEIQKRLDILRNGEMPEKLNEAQAIRVHYAEALEGKIVVGYQYGEELNTDIIKHSLYSLASSNAR